MPETPDPSPYRSPGFQQEVISSHDRWEMFFNVLLTVFVGLGTFFVTCVGAGLLGFQLFGLSMGGITLFTVCLIGLATATYISAAVFKYLNRPSPSLKTTVTISQQTPETND